MKTSQMNKGNELSCLLFCVAVCSMTLFPTKFEDIIKKSNVCTSKLLFDEEIIEIYSRSLKKSMNHKLLYMLLYNCTV